jgi:hypothetical protein
MLELIEHSCQRCERPIGRLSSISAKTVLIMLGEFAYGKHVSDENAFIGRANRLLCRYGFHR